MTVSILSIGDELILGQTVDTNTAWLAQRCAAAGLRPVVHMTVSDARDDIRRAIERLIGTCDVLLISGGLGPTDDDLTRHALADVLGTELALDPAALENVERFFRHLGRPMPERNQIQAMIPRGARMIENTNGTAPGLAAAVEAKPSKEQRDDEMNAPSPAGEATRLIFVMPGVPKEMKVMFERSVLPEIRQLQRARGGGRAPVILSRTLHTFGVGESAVADLLKPANLMDRARNPSVGTTVFGGVVSLRLNAYFDTEAEARAQLEQTEQACRAALGDLIYGADDQTLPDAVARLLKGEAATAGGGAGDAAAVAAAGGAGRAITVATAESCTGGLLAKSLTDLPGSSAYFGYGWVTYANAAKVTELGVAAQALAREGAVSEAVVTQMARGALERSGADVAMAISGVAGPDGGTGAKPVGTVWIALAARGGVRLGPGNAGDVHARRFVFPGDREMVRDRATKMALTMLRFHLLGRAMPF